jgi:hypothetical protein
MSIDAREELELLERLKAARQEYDEHGDYNLDELREEAGLLQRVIRAREKYGGIGVDLNTLREEADLFQRISRAREDYGDSGGPSLDDLREELSLLEKIRARGPGKL